MTASSSSDLVREVPNPSGTASRWLAIRVDLTFSHCRVLEQVLFETLMGERGAVCLDLSEVGFMDSSGVSLIMKLVRRLELTGGRLHLAGVGEGIRRTLETVRLDRLLRIEEDPE